MAKEVFALKVPSKLKRTMEFISKESGHPLSKLFYSDMERSTVTFLGVVLLHNLNIANVKKSVDIRELKNLSHISLYFSKKNVSPIMEFIDLLEETENQNRIKSIFPGIKLSSKPFTYEEVDLTELCHYMGEMYVNTNRKVSRLEISAVKNIFFDKMLKIYFDSMALGTIHQLEQEWLQGQPRLELFKRELLRDFDEIFQSVIVEPIIMDENAESAETPKTVVKRTKVPYTVYKSQDLSKRQKKRRKIRSKNEE